MDEDEWLSCADPAALLNRVDPWASSRKLLLFAVACCRGLPLLTTRKPDLDLVNAVELHADGRIAGSELRRIHSSRWPGLLPITEPVAKATWELLDTVVRSSEGCSFSVSSVRAFVVNAVRVYEGRAGRASERMRQSDLVRDLFGNSFRPAALDPAWRTPAVLSLAQAAYEDRILPAGILDPDRLAVLSDALEDAGCDSEEDCKICIGGVRMSAWEVCPCERCGGNGRLLSVR